MATGAMSSLGIGSGVLTSSVIDQLKANDTNLIIAVKYTTTFIQHLKYKE